MSLHFEKVQAKIGFGKEKETKFVGKRRLADPFTLERLAKEISHETMIRKATCEMVLKYMVEAIEDAIQDGRSIDIGIGTVSPAISTKAADEADDVKVVKKRVLFRASKKMRAIVEGMSVKLITDEDDADDAPDTPGTGGEGGDTPGTGGENSNPANPGEGGGGFE